MHTSSFNNNDFDIHFCNLFQIEIQPFKNLFQARKYRNVRYVFI